MNRQTSMSASHSGKVLFLLSISQFLIALDYSIVNVALPAIQGDLGFSTEGLQWILSAYSLALGGLLLVGGRMADLYGRRKIYIIGLSGFALASLFAGFAWNPAALIGGRILQGLSAAFVAPAAMGLLTSMIPEGLARNRALGIYTAVLAAGYVLGLVLGGVLTELISWRATMFVVVPFATGAAIAAPLLLVESRSAEKQRGIDVPGAVTVSVAMMALVYALSEVPNAGWTSLQTVALLIASAFLLYVFVAVERRSSSPIVPLTLFRIRTLVGANVANVLLVGAFVGMLFVLTLYLQNILGFSPIQTGMTFAVQGSVSVAAGFLASRVASRIGPVTTLFAGAIIQATSLLALAFLPMSDGVALVLIGTAFVGLGHNSALVIINIGAMQGVPANTRGVAGGLVSTSQQMGVALGLAVLVALGTTYSASLIGQGLGEVASTVAGYKLTLIGAAIMSFASASIGALTLRGHFHDSAGAPVLTH